MQQNSQSMSNKHEADDDRPLPVGLMMALAQNMQAMKQYAALSDEGRAKLIERASRAQSGQEMQSLVRNLSEFLP